jgi:ribonuclease HI
MTKRVYVDAKIEGIQDPKLNRKAYVAYVVKDMLGLQGFGKVEAYETDDAELHAIAFAIQQLKDKLKRFTVFSDHEPAVSQILLKDRSGGKKRPILLEILNELESNSSIKIELFGKNPAHRVLNKYVAELKGSGKN